MGNPPPTQSGGGGAQRLAPLAAALVLSACATLPAPARPSPDDCAAMMLVAGFIAEHQPPLRLRSRTQAVASLGWRNVPPVPETWSPDAAPAAILALGRARARAGPGLSTACPIQKSPFVPWRPGRAELTLSTPAYDPEGGFAVLDAAAILPGRRIDLYRFMLNRDGARWDLHRIEFASQALTKPVGSRP